MNRSLYRLFSGNDVSGVEVSRLITSNHHHLAARMISTRAKVIKIHVVFCYIDD